MFYLWLILSVYNCFIIFAGFPAITQLSGKDFVTTEFAPIIQLFPIVTLGKMQLPAPTHTLSPIITGPFEYRDLSPGGGYH